MIPAQHFGMILAPMNVQDVQWAVYSHRNITEILWVGCCKIAEIGHCPDARKNRDWLARVLPDRFAYTLIEEIHPTELAARRAVFSLVEKYKPICNRNYRPATLRQPSKRGPVRCIETGVIYANGAEAARAMGVTPAAIYNHLSAVKGFPHVCNKTFERVAVQPAWQAVTSSPPLPPGLQPYTLPDIWPEGAGPDDLPPGEY